MSLTVFRDKIVHLKDFELHQDGDLYWYAEYGIKSTPDFTAKDLGLHDKYGCTTTHCNSYLRIVYSVFLEDHAGVGRKEAHYGFCGGCAKQLTSMMPHKITSDTVADFALYFGKHKGKKLSEVPKDYLEWCLGKLTDDKIKKRIEVYLGSLKL